MAAPVRFALIGGGWRAEFFARITRELPDQFPLAGAFQGDAAKAAAFGNPWQGCPADG